MVDACNWSLANAQDAAAAQTTLTIISLLSSHLELLSPSHSFRLLVTDTLRNGPGTLLRFKPRSLELGVRFDMVTHGMAGQRRSVKAEGREDTSSWPTQSHGWRFVHWANLQ